MPSTTRRPLLAGGTDRPAHGQFRTMRLRNILSGATGPRPQPAAALSSKPVMRDMLVGEEGIDQMTKEDAAQPGRPWSLAVSIALSTSGGSGPSCNADRFC